MSNVSGTFILKLIYFIDFAPGAVCFLFYLATCRGGKLGFVSHANRSPDRLAILKPLLDKCFSFGLAELVLRCESYFCVCDQTYDSKSHFSM